jgi:hypothetical protein
MDNEQKYPSEVKQSILLKAYQCIARARKEKRLSRQGKDVVYKDRLGVEYHKTLEEMPEFFINITQTSSFVDTLVGDINAELLEIFKEVIRTPINVINPYKYDDKIEGLIVTLKEMAREETSINITKQINEIKRIGE